MQAIVAMRVVLPRVTLLLRPSDDNTVPSCLRLSLAFVPERMRRVCQQRSSSSTSSLRHRFSLHGATDQKFGDRANFSVAGPKVWNILAGLAGIISRAVNTSEFQAQTKETSFNISLS